jgi:hypothetical protein
MWKRGALAFSSVDEAALFFAPPVKLGASLAEKSIFQISKSAMARQTERQFIRTAEKASGIAAEKQIVSRSSKTINQNEKKFVNGDFKLDLDALSKAGQVIDLNGLTRAGRALDKRGMKGCIFLENDGRFSGFIEKQYE